MAALGECAASRENIAVLSATNGKLLSDLETMLTRLTEAVTGPQPAPPTTTGCKNDPSLLSQQQYLSGTIRRCISLADRLCGEFGAAPSPATRSL